MKEVVIVSAVRTPIGSFNGTLSSIPATKLGAIAISEAVHRAGIKPELVQEVYMGNVLQANNGQAPATQASKLAGLPDNVPSTTVNKVCASGMKSIMFAAQSIICGDNDIVVAGGMENMSAVPFYLDKARNGYRLGHGQLIDGLIKDGLWDVYKNYHMGNAAELCATDCKISREDQDAYAIESYKRAQAAYSKGLFKDEIIPIHIPQKGKDDLVISEDEEYLKVDFNKVPKLNPVFVKDGSVTAANASTLNDGAAALVLMSADKAKELGIKPIASIIGYSDAQQAPEWFTTAPAKALPLAVAKAGLTLKDLEYIEINEAFSAVAIANNNLMSLDSLRVNVNGGAVALGHPLGCSGARIIVTLISVLKQNNGRIGGAGICNGGGGASAMVIRMS